MGDIGDIEFIEESLMTDDGFVNPVAMAQIESAILNIGKTHERLADDPEWSTKKDKWVSKCAITSALAKWAIRQSPYAWPVGLENVIKYLDACLERSVDWDAYGMAELSLCDISKLLYGILYEQNIKDFDNWNNPKIDTGHDIAFTSSTEILNPDCEFMGLDALLHNVCLEIRNDRRELDEIDRKFEEDMAQDLAKESADQ